MKLSKLKFNTPINLIAQSPLHKKEDAKMMVVDRTTGKLENKRIKNLPDYLEEDDAVIINTTKVLNSRFVGKKEKTGHKIDVIILREINREQRIWDVIVDPARKIRMGNKIYFGDNDELTAEIIDNTTNRGRTIKFVFDGNQEEFRAEIDKLGSILLPDYIKQKNNADLYESYNSFFARHEGSIVAPFANLHLTPLLLKTLEANGVLIGTVIAHNGLTNHKPIAVEDLNRYKMEVDYHRLSENTAKILNITKNKGKKVCAIGVSTLRTIESALNTKNEIIPIDGLNKLFLSPPYDFKIVDMLLTNFNVPKSLFQIAAISFVGEELIKEAYIKAVKDKYRLFAFGDAMLVK